MEIEEFMFKLATGFQGHKKGIYVTGERLKTKITRHYAKLLDTSVFDAVDKIMNNV
jgi:hypothetical protein